MRLHSRLRLKVVLAIMAVLLMSRTSFAQDPQEIMYGDTVVGTIAPEDPLTIYKFTGEQGDLVTVRLVGLSSEFDPSVLLLNPPQQQVAANDNDVFAYVPGDARLSYTLEQTGLFTLIIGGSRGTSGDFVLRLEAHRPIDARLLEPDTPHLVAIPQNPPTQHFRFQALPDCVTTLSITPQPPTFEFALKVREASGELVAVTRGGAVRENRITVQPDTGEYEIEVLSANPITEGELVLLITCVRETDTDAANALD